MKAFAKRYLLMIIWLLLGQRLLAGAPPGDVIGWGFNLAGQATGIPTGNPPGTPNGATGAVVIVGEKLSRVIAVSTGSGHSLALTSEGAVFGWGNNSFGEATGARTGYPYRANGRVSIAGKSLSAIKAISAGNGISSALKGDGTVICWGEKPGEDNWGELKVPSGLSNVIAIAAGTRRFLALKRSGDVVEWDEDGAPRQIPAGLSNVVEIAAGRFNYGQNLALKADGSVVAWTAGATIQPVPDEVTNVISIASGDAHNLALRRDSTVLGWGSNRFGEATGVPTKGYVDMSWGPVTISGKRLTNIIAIAAGHEFSLALKTDGTVISWGSNGSHQTDAPAGLSNVVAISAGYDFCQAITTNSAVAERFHH